MAPTPVRPAPVRPAPIRSLPIRSLPIRSLPIRSAIRSSARSSALAAAVAALVASVLTNSPSAAAASSNPTPDGVVLAVTGLTEHGYSRQPGDRRWTNLGGILRGAPAVAQVGGITHIIGVNSRGYLVHRTNATRYHPITSSGRCSDPAAAASGNTVTIACIGMNRRGYTLTFDGRQHTPPIQRLTDIGGGLTSIAVLQTGEGPVFAATGGRYTTGEDSYEWPANTYLKDPSLSSRWQRLDLPCDGPLASTMTSTHWFSACQTDDAISVFVADADGEPSVFTVPGRAAGTIGIAAVDEGDEAVLAVQGLDGYIRHRRVGMNGSVDSRWTQLSGASNGGVAAAPTA